MEKYLARDSLNAPCQAQVARVPTAKLPFTQMCLQYARFISSCICADFPFQASYYDTVSIVKRSINPLSNICF